MSHSKQHNVPCNGLLRPLERTVVSPIKSYFNSETFLFFRQQPVVRILVFAVRISPVSTPCLLCFLLLDVAASPAGAVVLGREFRGSWPLGPHWYEGADARKVQQKAKVFHSSQGRTAVDMM